MESVKAYMFLSLPAKSPAVCGPFGTLQRDQEIQRYFQATRLCSCVSLHHLIYMMCLTAAERFTLTVLIGVSQILWAGPVPG